MLKDTCRGVLSSNQTLPVPPTVYNLLMMLFIVQLVISSTLILEWPLGLGVYSEKREQVSQIRFIMEFDSDGDSWICKASVEGMPEPKVYTYKFGEPYSSTDLMGKTFTCAVTKETDNKIIERITDWSDAEVVTERTVDDENNMTVVTTCKGVSFTAKYRKV